MTPIKEDKSAKGNCSDMHNYTNAFKNTQKKAINLENKENKLK
jgi:hypothetical protein